MAPEVLYGVGAVLLALGIGWAVMRDKFRNKANDKVTEQAAREIYRNDPETYSEDVRPDLKAKVKPQENADS